MNYWDSVGRWINTLLLFVVGVIGFDTLFRMLQAQESNVIVAVVRLLSTIVLVPFRGMFSEQDYLLTAAMGVLGYAVAVGIALTVLRSIQATRVPRRATSGQTLWEQTRPAATPQATTPQRATQRARPQRSASQRTAERAETQPASQPGQRSAAQRSAERADAQSASQREPRPASQRVDGQRSTSQRPADRADGQRTASKRGADALPPPRRPATASTPRPRADTGKRNGGMSTSHAGEPAGQSPKAESKDADGSATTSAGARKGSDAAAPGSKPGSGDGSDSP